MKIGSIIYDLVETFCVSAVVIFAIYGSVGSIELVWGASMEPTFHTGERILVDKLFRKFDRGEVVVLYPPGKDSRHFIKRIIGLPGDVFKIYNCKVLISQDGIKYSLEEDYLPKDICTQGGLELEEGRSIKVPEDSYIVLGDNRPNSADSRVFGAVKAEKILGRVVFRFWPLTKMGFVL